MKAKKRVNSNGCFSLLFFAFKIMLYFQRYRNNIEGESYEMEFVKDSKWVLEKINQDAVRIIDCRYDLRDTNAGRNLYKESHIPGATYFDLKEHLSAPVKKHGGRHPLPDLEAFKKNLEKAGIDRSKKVVAYDKGDLMYASRVWWLLKYIGHEEVYILEKGFNGWEERGYPVTKELPTFTPAEYEIDIQEDMLATIEEVKAIVEGAKTLPILIDSRAHERYVGEIEPIDRIAGHIPGAINKEWTESLFKGSFKSSKEQKQRFSEFQTEDPVIVYCGSGVSAIPNYIALKMAGFEHVQLYAGSYSDWISYEENEIATGTATKKDWV